MTARPPHTLSPDVYDDAYYLSEAIEGYEAYRRGGLSPLRAKHLALTAPVPGLAVLDIGFARGDLLRAVAETGARAFGLDYSPAACRIARRTAPAAALARGDAMRLPFADGSFDRVFAGDILEHQDREGGVLLLREMWRVLKPGGFLLAHTTPNRHFRTIVWPLARPLLRRMAPDTARDVDGQFAVMDRVHLHEYTPGGLRRAALDAGLPRAGLRVWVDPDLLRGDDYRVTRALASRPLVRLAAAVCARGPLLALFGNDLYLRCEKGLG
ncbi:MAG TPA: class I SAM-dependent methyltransferase [Candidatus Hydrogenedentes bacterium]|nr:class I SAM-dependent methyltransferase [Candidatus Hydrogenedentota bacterium]